MTNYVQVVDVVPRCHYTANGIQTSFPFTFPVFAAADLEVWVDQTRQVGSAYTVSGIGVAVGGSVLFTVPPAQGSRLTLRRRMALESRTDFPDTAVQAKPLNDALNYQIAAVQQVADDVGLSVRRSFRSLSSADLTLPEPQAGCAIKWNNAADGLENSAADADQVLAMAMSRADSASASASAAAVSAASASASATNAGASANAATNAAAQAQLSAALAGGVVKVSATDANADYLLNTLVAGANIALTRNNPGANETLSVAVTGLGTASVLNSDSDAALAANSDARLPTQKAVKAYVDAHGISAAEFQALQQDVLQNMLMDAVNGAWAAGSVVAGGFDVFSSDTIGVNSSGQFYDAVNKLYANPSTATATSAVVVAADNGGGYTTIDRTMAVANGITIQSIGIQSNLAITIEVKLFKQNSAGNYTAVVNQAFAHPGGNVIADCTLTTPYTVPAIGTYYLGCYSAGNWRASTASYARAYCSGDVTGTQAGIIEDTGNAVPKMRCTYAAGATNMTLVSGGLTPAPATVPAQIKIMVLWKDLSGSAVLNTDLIAEAGRDGATWSAGTLTDTGLTVSGFKVLWAVVDVAAQPAGTSVKYRLKTLNSKSQQVRGIALMTK
ncbi:MAG: hypothetical protein HY055_14260 [Magnetospirillum sp.]|nr:hypothetical protein [Magnetospirillum sp.]